MEQPTLPEPLIVLVTNILDMNVAPGELSTATTLESLGMDSLSLMELTVAAEQEYGIILPEEAADLDASCTLGDVARVFRHAS
jgi:acyl carrier protein